MTATSNRPLLEREPELARFDALLGELGREEGGALLLAGPPGIGKTSLLTALAEAASDAGVRVLRARGSELERSFAFGAVHQLLDDVLRQDSDRDELLGGAAALAEPVFAHHRSAIAEEDGSYPVLHGLYWLVSNLSRREPLLLIVDDLHWVDEPSRRFLTFLENRLAGMPVALAMAERSEAPEASDLRNREPVELITPQPLGPEAVEELLEAALGPSGATLAPACVLASGGNPFLLVEVVAELERLQAGGASPTDEDVERLAPAGVRTFALERVASVEGGEPVARSVAVLGDGAGMDRVAALAELDVDSVGGVADRLAAASVLSPGRPLGFAHPLIRVSIHEAMPSGLRSSLHRRAAAILTEHGDSPRSVATHLLETDPAGEETTVSLLVEVAVDSIGRGAPEPAIDLLKRALLEPPSERFRSLVELELGVQLAQIGDQRSVAHLRAALTSASSDLERARIGLALVDTELHNGRMAQALAALEEALEFLPEGEPELEAAISGRLLPLACSAASGRQLAGARLEAVAREAEADLDGASGLVLAGLAFDATVNDHANAARASELAERSLRDESLTTDSLFVAGAINALFLAGRFERAEEVFGALVGDAQNRGRARDFAIYSGLRAWSRWLSGHLDEAEADARIALELAAESTWEMLTSLPAFVAASIDLERGHPDRADLTTAPLEAMGSNADIGFTQLLHIAVARRLASADDHQGALDRLTACREFESAWGGGAGIAVVNAWRTVAAPSLRALGRETEARALAAEQLEAAETFGAPRGIGEALRLVAKVEDPGVAAAALERAVTVLEGSGALLELAYAQVELGGSLRRAGQRARARELLATGMDGAHRIGATALAAQAREELVLAGARPRRLAKSGPDSLTASERRVARMAADGMLNREIAQSLFVTLRTVEGHLSNAFRKLEISSREELRRAMRSG